MNDDVERTPIFAVVSRAKLNAIVRQLIYRIACGVCACRPAVDRPCWPARGTGWTTRAWGSWAAIAGTATRACSRSGICSRTNGRCATGTGRRTVPTVTWSGCCCLGCCGRENDVIRRLVVVDRNETNIPPLVVVLSRTRYVTELFVLDAKATLSKTTALFYYDTRRCIVILTSDLASPYT